jgi:hypothetical protein
MASIGAKTEDEVLKGLCDLNKAVKRLDEMIQKA